MLHCPPLVTLTKVCINESRKKGHRKKGHSLWKRGKKANNFLTNYETNIIDTNQVLFTIL